MGIIRKTRKTESLLSAEKKVCKRFLKAAPELPEEIPAFAFRYKGFLKAAAFSRQFGWYHGDVFVPFVIFMAGMEAFFIFLNFLCSAKASPLTSNQRIHKRIPPPCHTATVPLPLCKGGTKALFN